MQKTILIIDDSQETRELLRFALEEAGYKVEEADDGAVGLGKAKMEPFDLIITDLMMPRMDGFSFIQKLREISATSEIPVIISSAQSKSKEAALITEKQGFIETIEKPFIVEELIAKVNRMVKR